MPKEGGILVQPAHMRVTLDSLATTPSNQRSTTPHTPHTRGSTAPIYRDLVLHTPWRPLAYTPGGTPRRTHGGTQRDCLKHFGEHPPTLLEDQCPKHPHGTYWDQAPGTSWDQWPHTAWAPVHHIHGGSQWADSVKIVHLFVVFIY